MQLIYVRDIMQHDVITIRPEALVADAGQQMETSNVRRLVVVDAAGCVVGIVTDADVHEAEVANRVLNDYEPGAEEEWLTVGDVMTREVIMTEPDATVGQLAAKLIQHKVGGVPVVEPDPSNPCGLRLVGVVTETDLFRVIVEAEKNG